MTPQKPEQIALCSWSLQPESVDDLIAKVRQTGLSKVQLHLDPLHNAADAWADTKAKLADAGIEPISGMFTPLGENYSTPATIRATGGIVPDEHWDANLEAAKKDAVIANELGLPIVSFHAGFIPEEAGDPKLGVIVDRLRAIADAFAEAGAMTLFETGQESAETLAEFLKALDHPRIGVNFDPANMLLYLMGEPIPSMKLLTPWVKQVHLKDAKRPPQAGVWGEEVVVGTGEVDWQAFLNVLSENDFTGNMVLEREAGDNRVGDIKAGAEFITAQMGG